MRHSAQTAAGWMHHWKLDHAARRFAVWMAIGTAFILALVAADYFGAIPIP